MNPFLTATDLDHWADRLVAQGTLPLLVRRLVLATLAPAAIDFADGDAVNRRGYDGFLQTAEAAPLVPAGRSVWEMGTGQDAARKAGEDYDAIGEFAQNVLKGTQREAWKAALLDGRQKVNS